MAMTQGEIMRSAAALIELGGSDESAALRLSLIAGLVESSTAPHESTAVLANMIGCLLSLFDQLPPGTRGDVTAALESMREHSYDYDGEPNI
jgi:hypothetical protein